MTDPCRSALPTRSRSPSSSSSGSFSALAADGRLVKRTSLTQAMNAQREAWMHTMARRELRMIDTGIMSGLAAGHGLLRVERAGRDRQLLCAARRHRPGARRARPTCRSSQPARGVFETKTIGLIVLFAYAFFKFGWSYRLFNYCSILIGAVPVLRDGATHSEEIEIAVRRAARMNILAASTSMPACAACSSRSAISAGSPARGARAVDAAAGHRAGAAAVLLGGAAGADRAAAVSRAPGSS